MTKGEQTRQYIIKQAAAVFNQRGFTGSSLSDIMAITGLQKGGIYRHFDSKEDLALAAFDYAQQQITQRLEAGIKSETNAIKQLLAFISAFETSLMHPPVPGGCPILNTIVDSDDGDPALHARVLQVIEHWQTLLIQVIERGIAHGEVRSETHPQAVATIMLANLEGAILLARAHANTIHCTYVIEHLRQYIERDLCV